MNGNFGGRIRVASLQYYIRPVRTYEDFEAQVEGLVETSADYRCQLVVFPEYCPVQLLTLGDVRRPMHEQVRELAGYAPRFRETMRRLARRFGIHVVAGTIPVREEGSDAVYNECFVFGPDGAVGSQGKLHMTRFEQDDWHVSARSSLRVFDTAFGRMEEQLSVHLRTFPEGQFVAVDRASGRIVGMAASLIVAWDATDMKTDWQDFTGKGTFANHDPVHGRTLYGAEVMVHPAVRRRGIAGRLYQARRDLVTHLGLLRIRAAGRLRGYHRHAATMRAEEYVNEVIAGNLSDPTLSFQLAQGFKVLGVVQHYYEPDPESLGYAAVIEWRPPGADRERPSRGRSTRSPADPGVGTERAAKQSGEAV